MFDWSIRTIGFLIITFITIILTIVFEFLRIKIQIPVWVIILSGLVVAYIILTLVKNVRELKSISVKPNTNLKPNSKRKSIPNEFEIDIIDTERYQWSVLVERSWLPTTKPTVEQFSSKISLSKPICKVCNSDLLEVSSRISGSINYLVCPSKECNSNKIDPHTPFTMKKTSKIKLKIFKGIVRKNFGKYWKLYVNQYDSFTNKNYDKFWSPI